MLSALQGKRLPVLEVIWHVDDEKKRCYPYSIWWRKTMALHDRDRSLLYYTYSSIRKLEVRDEGQYFFQSDKFRILATFLLVCSLSSHLKLELFYGHSWQALNRAHKLSVPPLPLPDLKDHDVRAIISLTHNQIIIYDKRVR